MVDRHLCQNLTPWSNVVFRRRFSTEILGCCAPRKMCSQEENYFLQPCLYLIYVSLLGRTPSRGRGRGKARGASGALAAAAAAMAGAAAGSAAAYAAYGFSYQGNAPTPPSSRVSPVVFGAGPSPTSSGGHKQNTGVVLPPHVAKHEGNTNTPADGDQINVTRVDTNVLKNEKENEADAT